PDLGRYCSARVAPFPVAPGIDTETCRSVRCTISGNVAPDRTISRPGLPRRRLSGRRCPRTDPYLPSVLSLGLAGSGRPRPSTPVTASSVTREPPREPRVTRIVLHGFGHTVPSGRV